MELPNTPPPEAGGPPAPRAPGGCIPEEQLQYVVDGQLPPADSDGRRERPNDGEKRFKKRARKSPAQARWQCRRRTERFAKRLGFAPAEQPPTLLVVGGLGAVGRKHIQAALAELPAAVADCLDYVGQRPAAE
jgi:hypothetical protein